MAHRDKISLGIDFGTESVRALLVDLEGNERASAVVRYPHGQIVDALPTDPHQKLPPDFALQHPQDWIDSAAQAVRAATDKSGAAASDVIGIGVDFTSCTMLPTYADGRPLCMTDRFAKRPLAWPKLWKHHGAKAQSDRINDVAHNRNESFLSRYGGTISLEWFFPKVLETIEGDLRSGRRRRSVARSGRLVRLAICRRRRQRTSAINLPGGLQGDVVGRRWLPERAVPRGRSSAASGSRFPKNAGPFRCPRPACRRTDDDHGQTVRPTTWHSR